MRKIFFIGFVTILISINIVADFSFGEIFEDIKVDNCNSKDSNRSIFRASDNLKGFEMFRVKDINESIRDIEDGDKK
jgi:hypothetical protein